MVIVQFRGRLVQQYRLVSLILLGWELRVLYHCTMYTRHPDLVSLDFYAIPIIILKNFLLVSFHFNHNS